MKNGIWGSMNEKTEWRILNALERILKQNYSLTIVFFSVEMRLVSPQMHNNAASHLILQTPVEKSYFCDTFNINPNIL